MILIFQIPILHQFNGMFSLDKTGRSSIKTEYDLLNLCWSNNKKM